MYNMYDYMYCDMILKNCIYLSTPNKYMVSKIGLKFKMVHIVKCFKASIQTNALLHLVIVFYNVLAY